jgi:hypothetical protein
VLVVTFLCALAVLAALASSELADRTFTYYTRDPSRSTGASPLLGLLSNLGVLALWGAATAALLAGAVIGRTRGWQAPLPLLLLGAGSAFLALDDFFLIHESMAEYEDPIFAGYAIVSAVFLWIYREFFRAHDWPLLALAGGLLGASVVIDQVVAPFVSGSVNWLEDTIKLFGLAFLAAYLLWLSFWMLSPTTAPRAAVRSDELAPDERGGDAAPNEPIASGSR